jgi:hypothetical protein
MYPIANSIPPCKFLNDFFEDAFLDISINCYEIVNVAGEAGFWLDERLYCMHPPSEALDIVTGGHVALGQAKEAEQVVV